jgi:hypothetical protein
MLAVGFIPRKLPTTNFVASRRFNQNARAEGNASFPDLDAPHMNRR